MKEQNCKLYEVTMELNKALESLHFWKHHVKMKKKEVKNLKRKYIYHYEKKYGIGSFREDF